MNPFDWMLAHPLSVTFACIVLIVAIVCLAAYAALRSAAEQDPSELSAFDREDGVGTDPRRLL